MKKTIKFIGLIAMAAVLFSCEKKIDPVTPTPKDSEEQVTDRPEYNPGEYLVSFGATIESPETKATIDVSTGAVTFENEDRVLVVSGEENKVYVYNGEKFLPENENEPLKYSSSDILFYYPASCFDASGVFTMPDAAADLADLGDKAPMAAMITADGAGEEVEVTFKSLSSILRVQITGEKQLSSVKLEGAEASYIGAGTSFRVSWNGDIPSFGTTTTTEPSTSIEVASTAPLSETAQDFYFLLPSGQTIENLSLTATLAGNHNGGTNTFTISRSGSIDVSSPKIYTMSFYAGLFSGGTGTVQDPYKIATARDFKYISKYCAEGYTAGNKDAASFLGATYKQTADINFNNADLSAYMIGGASTPFTGTYNGKPESTQYTLSNFTISGTPDGNEGVAPFKAVNGAVLQNIAISNATVTGGKFTAGLVGYAKGAGTTIQNCSIASSTISDIGNDFGAAGLIGGIYGGTVTGCSGTDLTISTGVENKAYFGGIITYINGTVTVSGCELNGTTTVTNAQKFGGIIGQINNDNATITNCHNHSTINGSKNYNGGICGIASKGTISNCTNDGTVNGVSSTAGIVAQLDGATVDHCTNSGTIHGSENYAAGIVAYHTKGNLTNSVNTGAISADGAYVGGIAGMLKSSANYGLIKGCRSNATLSGASDVAGIVGRVTWGIVMDCFAKGSATGGLNTGGIVGYAYSADGNVAVMNCLASVDVTCNASGNQHSGGVIGRATCVDSKYVYIGNCAGLNNAIKATQSNAVRFGAFTGFTNAEKKSVSATPNRVRIWNSYTLVDDTNFQCANTGATADVGGFIGRMGAASDLGDCYYINDSSKSTLNGSTYKNITHTTAAVIGGTGTIAVNATRQGMSLEDSFLNVLNRCTYASNGTTRLTAFNDYPMCDWTMTGAKGEALSHPVPANLVALGEGFYE